MSGKGQRLVLGGEQLQVGSRSVAGSAGNGWRATLLFKNSRLQSINNNKYLLSRPFRGIIHSRDTLKQERDSLRNTY